MATDSSLFAYSSEDRSSKGKSPNALRTISEASDMLEVPQHVLRFWETKFPQIKPLKRNGGRRFYRPQDLDILQQVKFLLYSQGYTIKGAKKAIEDFARPGTAVETPEWLNSMPPASVNDNVAVEESVVSHEDAMAELAAELGSVPELALERDSSAELRKLREGLMAARAELAAALKRAA